MKKIVLTSICVLGMSVGVLAQGTLNWGSISFAYFTAQTNSTTYYGGVSTGTGSVGATQGAGSFYYELLFSNGGAADSLSSLSAWTDTGLEAQSSASAGRVSPINANAGAAVTGWAIGSSYDIVMVGWSANLGSDWATALAALQNNSWTGDAYFGVSSTGNITATSNSAPGASVFGGTGITSKNTQLYLVPVPEPTTIALAGLGAISLLGLRRKK